MDRTQINFERIECLEGTWTPKLAIGEDHFVGYVRHSVHSPGPFGYTTQVMKMIRLALPRAPYISTAGPAEIIAISSDSSSDEDDPDDEDYAPSDIAAAGTGEDVIVIESSSEEETDPDDSVLIISDPDSEDLF